MKNLLLITSAFPYFPGEQFLETEILFLAKAFDKVYIVPMGGNATLPIRTLPINVEIINDLKIALNLNEKTYSFSECISGILKARTAIAYELFHRNKWVFLNPKTLIRMVKFGILSSWGASVLENIVKKTSPSVIYSYWLSLGAVAMTLAQRNVNEAIPIISRTHGCDLYEERHTPPFCPFQPFLMRNLDYVIPISQDGKEYLDVRYPAERNKTFVSRLGVNDGKRSNASTDGILRIVSCSFLVPVKRIHLIIEALSLIDLPIHWTHIGDGPERSRIEQEIESKLKGKVNISTKLTGNMTNKDVLNYYQNTPVDLFINVSASEGIPVSIMEAMSRGIPVIATAVGGVPEIVDVKSGYLLPEDPSPKQIAQALTNHHRNSRKLKDLFRNAAYSTWKEHYDAMKNYTDFANWLVGLNGSK